MKMKKEHFDALKLAIEKVLKSRPYIVEDYELGNFDRSVKVKDLQKRFNWDLFYFSRANMDLDLSYLENDHIGKALNKICPKVERKFKVLGHERIYSNEYECRLCRYLGSVSINENKFDLYTCLGGSDHPRYYARHGDYEFDFNVNKDNIEIGMARDLDDE